MRIMMSFFILLVIPALASSATLKVPGQYPTIQDAIDAASGGDTVLVAPGTYVENIDFKGKAIVVTSEQGAEVTFIDGNKAGCVVTCQSGEGHDSVLDGFAVANGESQHGGGMYNVNSNPTVINCIFSKNTADWGMVQDGQGGGMRNSNSSPIVTNCSFIENHALVAGGGMANTDSSSPTVIGCTFIGNQAGSKIPGMGGGMYNESSNATVSSCTFSGNEAVGGWPNGSACGGMYNLNSDVAVTDCIFTGNSGGMSGGGMLNEYSSPAVANCTFTKNSAGPGGGGGMLNAASHPTVTHCVFTGNLGGGISSYYDSSSTVRNCTFAGHIIGGGGMVIVGSDPMVTNCIFHGNVTDRGGGMNISEESSPAVTNCTFFGNAAIEKGGGVYIGGKSSSIIINTIFWNDSAPEGPAIWLGHTGSPSTLAISYSDVQGGQSSCHVEPNCTLNWGQGMMNADPLFAAGPKGFCYLGQVAAGQPSDSPCVDTGSDLAGNLGMDIYWTRTDEIPDSGTVDMGFHYCDFLFPALQTDSYFIPESTGGVAHLLLLAGLQNAHRTYIILGSITGTEPGTPLPGAKVTLPLNWDIFTNMVIDLINTPVFSNFMGSLDPAGSAGAKFDTLIPIPGATGITMHFAYALNNPWDFVSNPVGIEIVP